MADWEFVETKKSLQAICISSAERAAGSTSSSDFTLQTVTPLKGIYKLLEAYFPITFNNVNSTNNTIYFNENSTNKTCTIPAGAYTISTIAAAIASAMTTASSGYATYTCAVASNTNLLTLTSTQNFSLTFGTNTANSMAGILGFPNTNTSPSTSATGTNMVNFTGTQPSFNVTILGSGEGSGSMISVGSGNSYTFKIPITGTTGSVQFYSPSAHSAQYLMLPTGTNSLKVNVRDDKGNTITLGSDFYLTLRKEE